MDYFGVYSQAFSIHFTAEGRFPEGEDVFWGGTAGLLQKLWFWNEVQGIFRLTGFGIERTKNYCRYSMPTRTPEDTLANARAERRVGNRTTNVMKTRYKMD